MNRDEILNMPAGHKLDMAIEYYVFKWPKAYDDANDIPKYSTDISAAWKVMEKMRKEGLLILFVLGKDEYKIEFLSDIPIPFILVYAGSAPLVICRAALLIVMEIE